MREKGQEMTGCAVREMKIAELVPADYNPRKDLKPGDREYEKLKMSVGEFGNVGLVVWNSRTGRVVGGHQRLKVMKDLGFETVKVSVVDLPDEKEKLLNLALNKIQGEWDYAKLKELLLEIDTGAFDIALTGFDTDEIEAMIGREGMIPVGNRSIDEEAFADTKYCCPSCGFKW